MKAGVLTFPGSNCDHDMVYVLRVCYNVKTDLLWYRDPIENEYDLLVVPGGFSYGDYLRAGAIARFAPAMRSLSDHARRGRPVFGVCNGFQILCEAGLLPGALIRNRTLKHICKTVTLKPAHKERMNRGLTHERYRIPVSHSDGNYRIDPEGLKRLQDQNQIAWLYEEDINGSVENIAGITNEDGNVLGMMPHPERAVDPLTGTTDGTEILAGILGAPSFFS